MPDKRQLTCLCADGWRSPAKFVMATFIGRRRPVISVQAAGTPSSLRCDRLGRASQRVRNSCSSSAERRSMPTKEF
jgi:hypothetical protein